jgi:hypothetical protein
LRQSNHPDNLSATDSTCIYLGSEEQIAYSQYPTMHKCKMTTIKFTYPTDTLGHLKYTRPWFPFSLVERRSNTLARPQSRHWTKGRPVSFPFLPLEEDSESCDIATRCSPPSSSSSPPPPVELGF